MEALLLERMREGLLQKQDNLLTGWLHATPLGKKKVLLGPSTEQAVHARLDVIDDAIQSKTRSLATGNKLRFYQTFQNDIILSDLNHIHHC